LLAGKIMKLELFSLTQSSTSQLANNAAKKSFA
jgi:hypothetical protein